MRRSLGSTPLPAAHRWGADAAVWVEAVAVVKAAEVTEGAGAGDIHPMPDTEPLLGARHSCQSNFG